MVHVIPFEPTVLIRRHGHDDWEKVNTKAVMIDVNYVDRELVHSVRFTYQDVDPEQLQSWITDSMTNYYSFEFKITVYNNRTDMIETHRLGERAGMELKSVLYSTGVCEFLGNNENNFLTMVESQPAKINNDNDNVQTETTPSATSDNAEPKPSKSRRKS